MAMTLVNSVFMTFTHFSTTSAKLYQNKPCVSRCLGSSYFLGTKMAELVETPHLWANSVMLQPLRAFRSFEHTQALSQLIKYTCKLKNMPPGGLRPQSGTVLHLPRPSPLLQCSMECAYKR